MRMSKPQNHGKDQTRVFLDVFSLSENESGVHFREKNLDLLLKSLSCFAVQYCRIGSPVRVSICQQTAIARSIIDQGIVRCSQEVVADIQRFP